MLQSMKHRGPDSTGYALYGNSRERQPRHALQARGREHAARLRVRGPPPQASRDVESRLASLGARIDEVDEETPYAFRVSFEYDGDLKLLADFIEDIPEAEVLSLGRSLEIVKDLGDAETVHDQYGLSEFTGTHGIGHVRMATESEVDIAGAHPYWAYPYSDVAVVHNGQLTNYFMWRRRLERAGRRFMSECDSEIIAVYLAQEMSEGARLKEAMDKSLDELDGVFTYIAVTKDELGVAKDELAAKPLVLYESDDLVALASEEIAIRADRRPRDRHVRPVRARGASCGSGRRAARSRTTRAGSRSRSRRRRGSPEIEDGVATLRREGPDDAHDQPRAAPAALRGGRHEVEIDNPRVAALARRSASSPVAGSRSTAASATSACGLIDGPEIHITGRVGWSACENMMSGVVVVDGNAGSLTGAALRGGDLVVRGRVGARTGIDQKGGTIIVGGSAGSMTGFMMQRGRMIICGDVGPGLGDSMYDGTIYVAGKVKSLGIDCVPGEWTDDGHRARSSEVPDLRPRLTARVPEVRLRKGALQLRLARAVREEAGDLMADENAPSPEGRPRPQPDLHARGHQRHPHQGRARPLPDARLLDLQADAALGRARLPPRHAHALRHRGLPREVRHEDRARRALREEAARARHPDLHHGHVLRRAVARGEDGAREGRVDGRHGDVLGRGRDDPAGARLLDQVVLPGASSRGTGSTRTT